MSFDQGHVFSTDTWRKINELGDGFLDKANWWANAYPKETADLDRKGALIEALLSKDWPT